jgi:Carboxypeptidase regulatory-like domain
MMLAAAPARAQFVSGTAAMVGTVYDTEGKGLAGASVVLRNIDTGYTRSLISDAKGNWSAPAMPVGTYDLDVSLAGLVPVKESNVALTVGTTVTRDVTLTMGAMTEAIVVSAQTIGDLTGAATSRTIGLKDINELPLRGRNFTEFVQLSPSVLQEPDRFGLVMSGQRSINSNVSIDGTDFNDPLQGNQRGGNEAVFFFPQTAVKEFQIVLSGAGAEVGRTAAGFVNVVTKSGSNTLHGELFGFSRSANLTSPDAFDRKLDASQNQYGGSIGGPIMHDRLFVFIGAEQNRLRVPVFVKYQTQAAGVTVPASLSALEGEFTGTNDPTTAFVRVDFQPVTNHTINLNYTYGKLEGENFNFNSPQLDSAQTFNYKRTTDSDAVVLSAMSVLGLSAANDVRFQVATDDRSELPNSRMPQITISGFGTIGGDNGRPRLFNSTRYEAADTLIFSRGRQQLKTGFDVNVTRSEQERETNLQGRYDFRSLADYVAGKISRYRQTMAGSNPDDLVYEGTQREMALFLEDRVDLSMSVTMTAGLRWEGQQNPQPKHSYPGLPETARIPNDMKMWQPRLGLAWNVGARGTTVVRMSGGIYAPRTPANLFQRVFTDNGVTTISVDSKTDPSVLNAVTFPYGLTALPPGVKVDPPRIFGFASNFQNPRALNSALTVEQSVGSWARLSVGSVHIKTTHLQRRWDHNLSAPTIDATGMPIYPKTRPNPNIGWYSVNESDAKSVYDAVPITLERERGRLNFQLNYTWSKNWDNDSNERVFGRETILNVFDPNAEWAPSKYDARHAGNATVVYALPAGFSIGGVLMARTGFPYTPTIGFDTQNDGNDDNDRAIINGHVAKRNSMRQPSFFDVDLRLAKQFGHLELMADWLNVTRASNKNFGNDSISVFGTPAAPVASAGQPLFAPSTARYGGPRQVQLGARILF